MRILRTKTLFLVLLLVKINAVAQELITFDCNGLTGNESAVSSTTNHPNLKKAILQRGSGLLSSKNKNRFNAKHWTTGDIAEAIAENDYMELSISPENQCTFSVSSITVNIQKSVTGPRTIAIRSSLDNYSTSIGDARDLQDETNTQQLTFAINHTESSIPIHYRIYMYYAESAAGSAGFEGPGNDIVVQGSTISNTTNPILGFTSENTYLTEPNTNFITSVPISMTNFSSEISIGITAEANSSVDREDFEILTTELTFTANGTQYVKIALHSDSDSENETLGLVITVTSGTVDIRKKNHYIHIIDRERPLLINEILADPSGSIGDANGDGISDTSEDEFIEIYNASGTAIDISNWVLADALRDRHIFPAGTIIPMEETIVVFGGGTPITVPGMVQTASSGSLRLNNGSDTIVLKNNFGKEILRQEYSIAGNIDQSIARELDLIGAFQKHSEIASNPENFSPGRYNTTNRSFSPTIKWTGNTDENWNTASNWLDSTVPQHDDIVEIPSGLNHYPTASESIEFNSLNIKSGASFIAKKDSKGIVNFEQNLERTNWYLATFPVQGEKIKNVIQNHILATGKNGNIGIAFYNNTKNNWDYQTVNSNREIKEAEGFAVKLASPGKLTLSGSVSTASVTQRITSDSIAFHLLGNPYTSYINLGTFLKDNKKILEEQSIWIWNPTASKYELKMAGTDSSFQIAPSKGFFIKTNTQGTITFARENQSHLSDTYGKKNIAEVLVTLANDSQKTTTKIIFKEGCTSGFDNGYDGTVFSGTKNKDILYTQLVSLENKKKLGVQSVPYSSMKNITIPLGVTTIKDQTISFGASTSNIPKTIKVYLEDKRNNTYTNLRNKNYRIRLKEKTKDFGRFYLHITSKTLALEEPSSNAKNIQIYVSAPRELTLTNVEKGRVKLSLYSELGAQIQTQTLDTDGMCKITIPKLSSGLYFIKITTKKGDRYKKFIIKKID